VDILLPIPQCKIQLKQGLRAIRMKRLIQQLLMEQMKQKQSLAMPILAKATVWKEGEQISFNFV